MPFVPHVGFHQGGNISREAYQPGCILVSTTLPAPKSEYIPHVGVHHVINNLMHSDDRRLCSTKPCMVHTWKHMFCSWCVSFECMVLCTEDVGEYHAVIAAEAPTVVGIRVPHHGMPQPRLQDMLQAARRLKTCVTLKGASVPLYL